VDSPGSGYGPFAFCCECGDEPSGSGATELVIALSSSCCLPYVQDKGLLLVTTDFVTEYGLVLHPGGQISAGTYVGTYLTLP
jgi:hypothetical protein